MLTRGDATHLKGFGFVRTPHSALLVPPRRRSMRSAIQASHIDVITRSHIFRSDFTMLSYTKRYSIVRTARYPHAVTAESKSGPMHRPVAVPI